MKMKQRGSIVRHHGYWFYYVKLPGQDKRRMLALRAPGAKHGLADDRPREMAEQAAARIWEEATRQSRKHNQNGATVDDVCAAYCAHAREYYRRPDGSRTSEPANIEIGLRLFRKMFGRAVMCELTHQDMLKHRDALIRSGLARVTVNRRIDIAKRMVSWAFDEAFITSSVKVELSQVKRLKRGRSAARETEPVRPVDNFTFEQTLSFMVPNTADMCRVHRLTGMRPEEVCALSWSRIDTSQTPWVYRPESHKNEWRGMPRVILIGAQARAILEKYRNMGERPFSPRVAILERMQQPGRNKYDHWDRRLGGVPQEIGEMWKPDSYRRTISYACRKAEVPSWGANRLRHAFATDVRRAFGYEACRAVLGHSNGARVTDRYSFAALEDEIIRVASPAVEALG